MQDAKGRSSKNIRSQIVVKDGALFTFVESVNTSPTQQNPRYNWVVFHPAPQKNTANH